MKCVTWMLMGGQLPIMDEEYHLSPVVMVGNSADCSNDGTGSYGDIIRIDKGKRIILQQSEVSSTALFGDERLTKERLGTAIETMVAEMHCDLAMRVRACLDAARNEGIEVNQVAVTVRTPPTCIPAQRHPGTPLDWHLPPFPKAGKPGWEVFALLGISAYQAPEVEGSDLVPEPDGDNLPWITDPTGFSCPEYLGKLDYESIGLRYWIEDRVRFALGFGFRDDLGM